ncbi:unnamed protein product [Linum trigynum]|uniref:CCHC-type domain-containing protein n=1 Tax=Linum trigynum TaxID=586398 RepID=A0AAV2CZH4_9ROSI
MEELQPAENGKEDLNVEPEELRSTAESLEIDLDKINLEDEDDTPLDVEDGDVDVLRMEAARQLGLIGRLLADKQPNIRSLKIALAKAWNLKKGFQITDLGDMLFAFQFLDQDDRNKVCFGGPWHYENNIMIFISSLLIKKPTPKALHMIDIWFQIKEFPAKLRTQNMAEKIANGFGSLVWFDDSSGTMWDTYMRMRVSISINNPLKKKIKLNIGGKLVDYLVKYEKLPMFCYSCGRIGHPKLRCPKPSGLVPNPFGMDLQRSLPGPRNWLSHSSKREDAELWASLRKKFDMESVSSNSCGERAPSEEMAEPETITNATQRMLEGKEPGNRVAGEPGKDETQEKMHSPLVLKESSGAPTTPQENVQKMTHTERKIQKQGIEGATYGPTSAKVGQGGALQQFVLGTNNTWPPKRSMNRVWRRQEQTMPRFQVKTQITPQKRAEKECTEMELGEGDETLKSKKSKVLTFEKEEERLNIVGQPMIMDGEKADPAKEQGRPAQ